MTEQKTVLITGVSRRLGAFLAHHFLDQGCAVVGTYRSERDSLKDLRSKGAVLHKCDFQDMAAVRGLISEVQEQHAVLRAVIHNASDWLKESSGTPPEEVFDRMMGVHAKAPYLINLALKDALMNPTGEAGDIIHITDYVAERGSKKHIAYAASKAALENLTLSFAAAYAPHIKVNSIAPALLKFNEGDDEAYKAKALSKAALPREGSFEEAAQAIDYLMNSQYITGRTLHLDGGRHIK